MCNLLATPCSTWSIMSKTTLIKNSVNVNVSRVSVMVSDNTTTEHYLQGYTITHDLQILVT